MSERTGEPGRRRRRTGREILPLTLDRLPDLPDPCATCVFWERPPGAGPTGVSDPLEDKRGWLASTLLDWGSPGRIAYLDAAPAGYLTYAPAGLVPRALAFPTSPVSDDALVLVTARVRPEYAARGLGRALVQAAAKDALRRGHRAIEAFATPTDKPAQHPTHGRHRPGVGPACLLPVDFLTAVGFATVREHAAYPRLRLDLRTVLTWRAEVGNAVERLFRPVRDFGTRQPVGSARLSRRAGP